MRFVDVAHLEDCLHAEVFGRVVFHQWGLWTKGFDERFSAIGCKDASTWDVCLGASIDSLHLHGIDTWGLSLVLHDLQRCLDCLCLFFIQQYILFHLFEVHSIIKVNDILRFSRVLIDDTLGVYFGDVLFALEEVSILLDDYIECNVLQFTYLRYRIYRTHHQLVHMSIYQQLWFAAQH